MFVTIFKLVVFFGFVLLVINGLRLIVFLYKIMTGRIRPKTETKKRNAAKNSKIIELDKDQYHVD
ncbi:MAG: hypothetical protein JXK07_02315 [Spirochaetes bacterium]|nr:hypothetical protein [Spirochaetota bacterium]MBN2771888.1 hypothetical protein [Spirochaetota bacterium]